MYFSPSSRHPMPSTPAPETPAVTSALPMILWLYTLAFHIFLPAFLVFIYTKKDQTAAQITQNLFNSFTPEQLLPTDWNSGLVMISYSVCFSGLVLAIFLPRYLQTSRPSASSGMASPLVRYLIRLCSLEICTMGGFVLGFLSHTPSLAILPAAVGFAATLAAFPRQIKK